MALQAIGAMRDRVAFDKRSAVADDLGNESGEWTEQLVVSARIRPLVAGEAIQAARLQGQQPVVITIHYSDATQDITPDWRARDARTGLLYNIRSVANNDERKAYLDVTAIAGQATG
jgi:SPP1 family predicted phage head-tail adaptor